MVPSVDFHNSYKQLVRRKKEPCDFCDKIFRNRFDSIMHNASHIIIPLIKQDYQQCSECLYYFASSDDLKAHCDSEHPKKSKPIKRNNCKVKFENEELSDFEDVAHNSAKAFKVKREAEDCHTNEVVSQYLNCVTEIKHGNNTDYNKEKITNNSVEVKTESIDESEYTEEFSNDTSKSFKSRLKFESDEDIYTTNNVLNDLITECKVQVFDSTLNTHGNSLKERNKQKAQITNNNKPLLYVNKCSHTFNHTTEDSVVDDFKFDNFVLGNVKTVERQQDTIKRNPTVQEADFKSVHYKDLMRPGIYNCKYCYKSYPNRFSLIQHEPQHIKISKGRPVLCTFCDKYIAGNYRSLYVHIRRAHPRANVEKKHTTHRCKKCGLKFRKYMWHIKNYHPYDCHSCGQEFGEKWESLRDKHVMTCKMRNNVSEKILNVCTLCYSFFKVKLNTKYIYMGTVNELGVRYPCSMCGKKFFELKTVKRLHTATAYRMGWKERKPLSNEERLKKFQHRLKKINRLNKFYTEV